MKLKQQDIVCEADFRNRKIFALHNAISANTFSDTVNSIFTMPLSPTYLISTKAYSKC